MMRATVQPGVRMGRRRERTREAATNNEDEVEGIFLPVGVDLHQITIVSKAEWQRIQDSLTATAREAARIRAERKERKDLHLKSQALVKNWTNTIAGMAQTKLKAKNVRHQREEEERRKIDIEEAKYQAQKRKEMIEQSNIQQYYLNDRVKGFHRALLLTEVLKERDAQVEFKKKTKYLYLNKEEEIEREHQKAIQREEEKVKERRMNRLQLNKDQLEQIKEHEHLAELNRLEEKKYGEEIKALVNLHQMEMLKKEQEEYEQKIKHRQIHQEYVADQLTLRAIERQKQEEEDDKVRAHYKIKKAMNKLKKEKEEEILRLMEERRDNIASHLLKYTGGKIDHEDERIAREIAETEEELEREHKAKEEKNKADLESIRNHRLGVIKMKEEKAKQEKLEAQETLRAQMEADRIYQELEKDKKHRNHCASLKLQETHVMQMAEKVARQEREKQEDLDYIRLKERIALWKEQEFQEYAKKVIDEASKTAQNLYPLIRAANEDSPGFTRPIHREKSRDKQDTKLPFIGSTAQEMKLLHEHGNQTKARLGFTW